MKCKAVFFFFFFFLTKAAATPINTTQFHLLENKKRIDPTLGSHVQWKLNSLSSSPAVPFSAARIDYCQFSPLPVCASSIPWKLETDILRTGHIDLSIKRRRVPHALVIQAALDSNGSFNLDSHPHSRWLSKAAILCPFMCRPG